MIDTIMNPTKPTPEQIKAAFAMTAAVAEAIRAAGQIPAGTLYAALCAKVDIQGFDKMMNILKGAGLVREVSHLLIWIGPEVSA